MRKEFMRTYKALVGAVALGVTVSLALSGCSGTTAEAGGKASTQGDGGKGTIKIVSPEGGEDTTATSLLWEYVLKKKGYDVKVSYVGDVGVAYASVASGDNDLYLASWLPVTQGAYYKQYGDRLEKLGVWNKEASLSMAVNADAPIDSLDELAAHAGEFDNKIIGIEAGAGMTGLVQDKLIPDYGLDKMQFLTSSTPAMLSELKSATEAKRNIVVTLWQPHWAYGAFPLKNLKDPKGVLGAAEELTAVGRSGFAKDHPEVANWIKNWSMDTATLSSLMADLFQGNSDPSQYESHLTEWISKHGDYVDGLTK